MMGFLVLGPPCALFLFVSVVYARKWHKAEMALITEKSRTRIAEMDAEYYKKLFFEQLERLCEPKDYGFTFKRGE